MELVEGVALHLLKNDKFKNNHLTFRFSGDFNQQTVARRVLVAQILATANAAYPTAQQFREKLARLYGASLSTRIATKGLVHMVDIDITFVKDRFAAGEKILEEIFAFLQEVLFSPLISVEQYQSQLFAVEQANLVTYLEADMDDSFYSSELEMRKLFYGAAPPFSKYGTAEQVRQENAFTAFQEFQKMLREDQLDIFILGEFDDYRMLQLFNRLPLDGRHKALRFYHQQAYENVLPEKIDRRPVTQSVLQLAYHFPVSIDHDTYDALLVFNGMLGAFSHSRLFTEVREKAGLAYTIGSHFDLFTGLFTIYAGIDGGNRNLALQMINKQVSELKVGRFSSALLKQTQKLISNQFRLSEDNPKVLIERAYNQAYLPTATSIEETITRINRVTKADILKIAKQLRLQAVYFLEGE